MTVKETRSQAGSRVFAAAFVLAALILLFLLGPETKFSARGQLFAQPRFWPAVGVIGMVFFGLGHLAPLFKHKSVRSGAEVLVWLRAVEYLIWFMVYVFAVPIVGYLGATVCFTVLLALRQGYRGANQLGIACGIGVIVVLVFKTGLSVKIPGGAIYDYLPAGLRNFMIVNF